MAYAAQALLAGESLQPAVALIATLPFAAVTAVFRIRTIRERQSTR